ncbi:MAG TPA: peptide chain release factor N(5)-glutamine methyltransferase [Pyrinomonadaceae bacterium]|nr:peptide chain release factor N(5)-glutamine methyltransferase [Pyrinomonadaceae bacterium]
MSKHTNTGASADADETASNAGLGAAEDGAGSAAAASGGPPASPATIAGALSEAAGVLRAGSVADARREAATLLAATAGRDRAFLIAHDDDELPADVLSTFRERTRRRAAGEPLQYVTGRQEFYGLDFEVNAAVLIPRPETELLVEAALELLKGVPSPLLCDVGTGSGCIPVAVLHERADVRAVAVDISLRALRVAARNAARHGVAPRLALVASDCLSALDPAAQAFDIIVSNPPYVAEDDLPGLQREVRDHEPRVALTPGGDGLSVIRRLLADSPLFLKAGGQLLFEIGFNQHEAVRLLVDPRVWTTLDIHRDLQGIPRTVALRLNP